MCGFVLDRDVKTARNILKRGLEIDLERAEYTPEAEETTTHLSADAQATSMITWLVNTILRTGARMYTINLHALSYEKLCSPAPN
jgi:hypothetical protein